MRWAATRASREGYGSWRVEAVGRTIEVKVPLGEDLLHRLERAVLEALGVPLRPPPSPPRYGIRLSTHSHGDLFELEVDTVWTGVDEAAGKPLWEFRGGTSHVMEGGGWSAATGAHGCDEVALGADGLHVLARDNDRVDCHPLPEA